MRIAFVALLLFVVTSATAKAEVVFDWATVGNAGNENDSNGLGGVSYDYRISKHEVTNSQYAEFLNAVAATDSFGGADPSLYSGRLDITRSGSSGSFTYAVKAGYEQKPVRHVSFFDAMRFVNWLENGQGASGTESGVYNISNGTSERRAPGATFFLPSADEWHKAAFHDPGATDSYWLYPTQSNVQPSAVAPPGGVNSANYDGVLGDTTDVGAYTGSTSFYGTFDQAGNVMEWIETFAIDEFFHIGRFVRGGGYATNDYASRLHTYGFDPPTLDWGTGNGFRVASVPEPSAGWLAMLVVGGLIVRRRRLLSTH